MNPDDVGTFRLTLFNQNLKHQLAFDHMLPGVLVKCRKHATHVSSNLKNILYIYFLKLPQKQTLLLETARETLYQRVYFEEATYQITPHQQDRAHW